MNEMNSSGMGITSIWDIIVLVIVARLFGFGLDGQQNNASTPANTEAQIERAIRASQDTQNTQNALAATLQKLNDCCSENRLGQKDIQNGQTQIIDGLTKAVSDIIGNQNIVALQTENRELTRNLSVAENALNNCNQTAAFTSAINSAVYPLAQAVSNIMAQLNCGIKSVPYTPSVPAVAPVGYDLN